MGTEKEIDKMIVGRGATAIYLALEQEGIKQCDVIVPANICYAAVYPIIYSQNNTKFCDVEYPSGNVSWSIIKECITPMTKAVIVPHMYGNPVSDIEVISNECKKRKIIMIEDCASCMGATTSGKKTGTFGDYAIFSTGYSKILDIGIGGILVSNTRKLDVARKLYDNLPLYEPSFERETSFFSKVYRLIRNNENSKLATSIIPNMDVKMFVNVYLFRLGVNDEAYINEQLCVLDEKIKQHREHHLLYDKLLKNTDVVKYSYSDGAVPWRYSMLLHNDRRLLIEYILGKNLPVSDWYPNVTPLFGNKKEFFGVDRMEREIVNFPLDVDVEVIRDICASICTFYKEKK